MIELGVSQAQARFTTILSDNESVLVLDKFVGILDKDFFLRSHFSSGNAYYQARTIYKNNYLKINL